MCHIARHFKELSRFGLIRGYHYQPKEPLESVLLGSSSTWLAGARIWRKWADGLGDLRALVRRCSL
jgi:hypothetical protein